MIAIGFIHTFVLVGPNGESTLLASADLDEVAASAVLDEVASAIASRVSDPAEYQRVREAATKALERLEERPGTDSMAGERLQGDRLLRIFRHLPGQGPMDEPGRKRPTR